MERNELIESAPNRSKAGDGTFDASARTRLRTYLFRLAWFIIMWLVVAFPLGMIHLAAIGLKDTPGSPAMTTRQGLTAAAANTLGPWAGHAVRAADFPNAGLRGFNLGTALGLSLMFVMLMGIGVVAELRLIRWIIVVLFAVFLLVWYGYGFYLIADGML